MKITHKNIFELSSNKYLFILTIKINVFDVKC